MLRRLLLVLMLVTLGGCRPRPIAYDPFLGRTTVPPPGTGVAPGYAPPYQPPPTTAAPPITSPPPGYFNPPPGGAQLQPTPYQPPNGYSYPQSSFQPGSRPMNPTEARLARSAIPGANSNFGTAPKIDLGPTTAPAARTDAVTTAGWQTEAQPTIGRPVGSTIRIVEPAPKAKVSAVPATPGASSLLRPEPRRLNVAGNLTEITDLPKPSKTAPPTTSSAINPSTVGQNPARSFTPSAASSATINRPGASYGYDPNYASLTGKLEYSQSARRWKLRYIPVDGVMDDFGGSVVFPTSADLHGFQPGDFVAVQGSLGETTAGVRSFAPTYNLQRIRKQ